MTDVAVSSTDWSSAFIDQLETSGQGVGGYSIPLGVDQEDPLPWTDLNQIRLTFSDFVEVDIADLSLSGVNQASYLASDFDYNPETREAVWTFDTPLSTDSYQIDLDADGLDPVVGLDGNALDGEWTNSVTTGPSGDGVAGGDFEFAFRVLPGDFYGFDILEYNNLYAIYLRVGLALGDTNYETRADVDGDGLIETSDWQVVWNNLYAQTPSGATAGETNDAPTAIGLDYAAITSNDTDVAFSLYDAFEDAEDTDAQLTYSIQSNSDPSLFDSVSINQQTGELIVDPASGVMGRAKVVVVATDTAGLSTQSTATIDVNQVSDGPTLSLTVTDGGLGQWLIEGWVTDSDDDLDDLWVVLLGAVPAHVSVAETGYFAYVAFLEPGEGGFGTAFVVDSVGSSNLVDFEIGFA